ncbi:hypothetical protein Nmel_008194, partial [Mimus melanotis]
TGRAERGGGARFLRRVSAAAAAAAGLAGGRSGEGRMAFFVESFWGERNNGFDVLYHNMKHGHLSTKDLADFIRERATIEETYSRSMTKLAKSASNYTQLGTFAPVWDVFKTSTEKLASCHLDLVRRLQELIKEVHKYGDEQIKAYKKVINSFPYVCQMTCPNPKIEMAWF